MDAMGSVLVPGLEVISVARLDEGAPAGTIRALQLLESGDTLEILDLPAGSDPSQLAARAGDGRTELVAPRDGGWIILRARTDFDTLRGLVARMGAGG
jgi:hypothetical protein